jgi:hypothetical protein
MILRLMFGEWITEEILYPLPHRQYVFTLPKVLRPYFRFDRKLLGKLSQCAHQFLKKFFQTTLNGKKGYARGGRLHSNLRRPGQFSLPPALSGHRRLLYGQRLVLRSNRNRRKEAGKSFSLQGPKSLFSEKRTSEELVEKLLSWKNSGFSIHNQVKIKSRDRRGRKAWPNISSVPHFFRWRKWRTSSRQERFSIALR